jgi:hypothetical protein
MRLPKFCLLKFDDHHSSLENYLGQVNSEKNSRSKLEFGEFLMRGPWLPSCPPFVNEPSMNDPDLLGHGRQALCRLGHFFSALPLISSIKALASLITSSVIEICPLSL